MSDDLIWDETEWHNTGVARRSLADKVTYCFGHLIEYRYLGQSWWEIDGEEVSEDEALGFMEACDEAP